MTSPAWKLRDCPTCGAKASENCHTVGKGVGFGNLGNHLCHKARLNESIPSYVQLPLEPTMGQWDDFNAVSPIGFDDFMRGYKAMIAGMGK